MKLQVAASIGLFTALLAPLAAADAKPLPKPATPPSPNRSVHPPTALHPQPHSKNATPPPQLHLPQLPPPNHKPTTGGGNTTAATPPPPSTTTAAKPATPTAPPKPPCLKQPVSITRGVEEDRFSLTKCDGSVAPESVEHLSILARSGEALKPAQPVSVLAKVPGDNVAPGIRRIDPRLVEHLQLVVDKFMKTAQTQKLHVISGYRPASAGSYHASARAIDFRMDGVSNEELVAFCKTLPDTGCGYYPNSSFVHMDVREAGTGHVTWIDASGPGEAPRYVPTWPPPKVDPPTWLQQLFGKQDLPAGADETPADPKAVAVVPPPPEPPEP